MFNTTMAAAITATATKNLAAKVVNNPEITKEWGKYFSYICGDMRPEVKGVIEEVADAYNVNTAYTLATAMTLIGATAGNNVIISNPPYSTNLATWVCMVAPSGYGKTEPLTFLMRPLEAMEQAAEDDYRHLRAKWRASKKNDEEEPTRQSLIVSDTTNEALMSKLAENQRGLIYFVDELVGWVKNFNRYTKSGEVQQLLSIWSAQPIHVSRMTRGDVYCARPFLSVIGGTQNAFISETFGSQELINMGFDSRFIFVAPEVKKDHYATHHYVRFGAQEEWHKYISEVRNIKETNLTFSVDAEDYINQVVRPDFSIKQTENEETPFLSGLYGKLPIYVVKYAGIIHIMSEQWRERRTTTIDMDTIKAAHLFCSAAEEWGKRVFSLITAGAAIKMTQKDLIKNLHKKVGIINQSEFARSLGLTPQYINHILAT